MRICTLDFYLKKKKNSVNLPLNSAFFCVLLPQFVFVIPFDEATLGQCVNTGK